MSNHKFRTITQRMKAQEIDTIKDFPAVKEEDIDTVKPPSHEADAKDPTLQDTVIPYASKVLPYNSAYSQIAEKTLTFGNQKVPEECKDWDLQLIAADIEETICVDNQDDLAVLVNKSRGNKHER